MLFKPFLCDRIKTGHKTVTRRVVQEYDIALRRPDGTIWAIKRYSQGYPKGRYLYEVGKTYAVQPGRGKAAVGHIRLDSIRKEPLQDISEEQAVREGLFVDSNRDGTFYQYDPKTAPRHWWVNPIDAFKDLWDSINGKTHPWAGNPEVWVLEFRQVDTSAA